MRVLPLVRENLTDRIQKIEEQFLRHQCFSGLLNPDETAKLDPRRADFVDPALQFCLGERLAISNPAQAVLWLEQASRLDFVIADYYLGKLYAVLASKAESRNMASLNRLSSAAYHRAVQKARRLEEKGDP